RDTKSVHNVHDVFVGIVLPEFVPFFWADEFLKCVAENVGRNNLEVESINCGDGLIPSLHSIRAGESHERSPFFLFWKKHGLVIACYVYCVLESGAEIREGLLR